MLLSSLTRDEDIVQRTQDFRVRVPQSSFHDSSERRWLDYEAESCPCELEPPALAFSNGRLMSVCFNCRKLLESTGQVELENVIFPCEGSEDRGDVSWSSTAYHQ